MGCVEGPLTFSGKHSLSGNPPFPPPSHAKLIIARASQEPEGRKPQSQSPKVSSAPEGWTGVGELSHMEHTQAWHRAISTWLGVITASLDYGEGPGTVHGFCHHMAQWPL